LSFYLAKIGSPTGDVTFTIRRVSDDLVLVSKVMGDASILPDDVAPGPTWKEVTFDSPIIVNEEVRILAEFSGGDINNTVELYCQNTDVKADEYLTWYIAAAWVNVTAQDAAYKYTYTADPYSIPFSVHLPKRTLDVHLPKRTLAVSLPKRTLDVHLKGS